ncbi:MAG: PIN domain-containing protein [Wenzhouxiangella sp.]|nr:PIN domain-containing protein [Wenzhouxiangella sp.]MDR9453977.1 PIN domain-containing protein [Wenzhouxiangella sp.]
MSQPDAIQLRYLLDSVIIIDHLNGVGEATEFMSLNGHESAISVITRAEVLAGVMADYEQAVVRLLNQFITLPVTTAVADQAAKLRQTERWKLPDAIQAAVAMDNNLVLVTRNSRDFKDGQPVRVLTPYST